MDDISKSMEEEPENTCFVTYDVLSENGETITSGEFPHPYLDGCAMCHSSSTSNEFSAKIVKSSGCTKLKIEHLPTNSVCVSNSLYDHDSDECIQDVSFASASDECSQMSADQYFTEEEANQINENMASFSEQTEFPDVSETKSLKLKLCINDQQFIPLALQVKLDSKPSPHDEKYKPYYEYHEEDSYWSTNPSTSRKRLPEGYRWTTSWAQEMYNDDVRAWQLENWPPIELPQEEWWVIQPANIMVKRNEQTQCFVGEKVYVEQGKQWRGEDLEQDKIFTFEYSKEVITHDYGNGDYESREENWTETYKVVGKEIVQPYQSQYFERPIDYSKPLVSSTKWIKNNSGAKIYPTTE